MKSLSQMLVLCTARSNTSRPVVLIAYTPVGYCSSGAMRLVGRALAGTTRGEPSQVSENWHAEGHISRTLEISELLVNTATSEMEFWVFEPKLDGERCLIV